MIDSNYPKLIKEFLEYRDINNSSVDGIKTYDCQLKLFFKWTKENKILKEVNEEELKKLESIDIENYISYCKKKGDKDTTRALKIRVLKSFFNWLELKRKIGYNIMNEVSKPKVIENNKLNYLSIDQVKSIIKAVLEDNSAFNKRDYVFIQLYFSTGMRQSELINLDIDNIDLENKMIINIKGKGGKTRDIELNDEMFDILYEYIDNRDEYYNLIRDTKALFLNKNGERLKKDGINNALKKYGKKAKIDNFHNHVTRHTFATTMLENGADIVTIKDLLGHSNISTTTIYAKATDKKRREAVNRISFSL